MIGETPLSNLNQFTQNRVSIARPVDSVFGIMDEQDAKAVDTYCLDAVSQRLMEHARVKKIRGGVAVDFRCNERLARSPDCVLECKTNEFLSPSTAIVARGVEQARPERKNALNRLECFALAGLPRVVATTVNKPGGTESNSWNHNLITRGASRVDVITIFGNPPRGELE